MKLERLYIENFMCHESSYIDFSQFNSALIVGKVECNDLYSNGVGKSTIFKSIEYVLFNQADVNLDKIIRDDADNCKITLDIADNNQQYRIVRIRTKKGASDLSLFERTSSPGSEEEVYHIDSKPITSKTFWKDISGRRAADTEKELSKLIKINFKSFRSTVHFMQNDFSGLATATPEKRKGILKEALNLSIYSKLEKIAKEKSALLSKDIDKYTTLIDNINDLLKPDDELSDQILKVEADISNKQKELDDHNVIVKNLNDSLNQLISDHSVLESKFSDLVIKERSLQEDKNKLESLISDLTLKKSNMIKSANDLIAELKILKEEKESLSKVDLSKIEDLSYSLSTKKDNLTSNNIKIQNLIEKITELKIPIPEDGTCKHCRQTLTLEHREVCQNSINKEILDSQNLLNNLKSDNSSLTLEINSISQQISGLELTKKKIENISSKIESKTKELSDKKSIHKEYLSLLESSNSDLSSKISQLEEIKINLQNSSKEEADKLKSLIKEQKNNINLVGLQASSLSKDIDDLNSSKAVLLHNIDQNNINKGKKKTLEDKLSNLNKQFEAYPSVLQAFSSTGIPNLIIQNVLDDLQLEANNLLSQLKPGLQLSFAIEKTKGDGTEADTLDIFYYLGGRERQYDQLSGAQKLAVTFSLKLGLSFLLQRMIGTDIKFLLLDEIDQSLDKAGVDAFADIVKFFQKDFTILVITHNDRLKDKFAHAILVEQDTNMVSKAKVVSSW